MSSPPGEEPAAWLAQIIQFWLGPSPKAPRPSGKPWIVPNGPRPLPLTMIRGRTEDNRLKMRNS